MRNTKPKYNKRAISAKVQLRCVRVLGTISIKPYEEQGHTCHGKNDGFACLEATYLTAWTVAYLGCNYVKCVIM